MNRLFTLLVIITLSILIPTTFILGQEDNESSTFDSSTPRKAKSRAESHRSNVSVYVNNLLELASKAEGNIGEEMRLVAQEQNSSKEKISEAIEKIEKRGSLRTFLIGTDYKNLGKIRSELAKNEARLNKLNRTAEKMTSSTLSATTSEQIANLTKEQEELKNFIKQNESKLSLFGWFVKLFSK